MILGNKKQIEEVVKHCFLKKEITKAFLIYDKNYVVAGTDIEPNYSYIKEHNIEMFDIKTSGGTIVVSKGDVGIGIFAPTDMANAYLEQIKTLFLELLDSREIAYEIDNNDILIDGYKTSSYSSKAFKGMTFGFGVFQFSINVDLELIKNICNKPMVKVPKGLSEFGITTQDIVENIINKLGD